MVCNIQILEKYTVILSLIYLVSLYFLRIKTSPFLIGIELKNPITPLIVGIPTETVNMCKAFTTPTPNFAPYSTLRSVSPATILFSVTTILSAVFRPIKEKCSRKYILILTFLFIKIWQKSLLFSDFP